MRSGVVSLSFGYLVTKSYNEGKTRVLDEVDLFEITLTSTPANADTHVLSMKAMDKGLTTEELRRRCEELGVLPRREKSVDRRPIQIASFDA
jgi:phage head maturation protease